MSNGFGGNSNYFTGFNDTFGSASPFGNKSSNATGGNASPFDNPFDKPADVRSVTSSVRTGMDQDQDDDMKYNVARDERSEELTDRQKKIQKFLKLQQGGQGQPKFHEKGQFIKKGAKEKKKRQQKKDKLKAIQKKNRNNNRNANQNKDKKTSKKRATSLTRNNNNDQNNANSKQDYIFFNEPQEKQQKTSPQQELPKDIPFDVISSEISMDHQKKNKYDALNLELPKFDATSNKKKDKLMEIHSSSYRSIRVPGHRMIHVRRLWTQICDPVIHKLKLQIRMNSKKNVIELRMIEFDAATESEVIGSKGKKNRIQKGSDFIRAAVMGFELRDALALIRMDDIYLETFDIRDVKFFNKKSDHWMRAIGRIAGQYGKIKYSIENSTNTRVVIFGFKVHILGSFSSIRLARNSISRLIIGSAPGNVYAKLRVVSNKLKHRF